MPRSRSRLVAGAAALSLAAVAWVTLVSRPAATGAAGQPGTTVRASVADGNPGAEAPEGGGDTMVSGDGRFVVFDSLSDLQPGGPGNGVHGRQAANIAVFVRDLQTDRTSLVSMAQDGPQVFPANGDSKIPSITADGRYVSFLTQATDISGAADGQDRLVVCDRGTRLADGGYRQPPAAGHDYPGFTCVTVASVPYPQGFVGFSDDVGGVDSRPTLAAVGAFGSPAHLRIAWTSFDSDGYDSASARYADIPVDAAGRLGTPATPVVVPNAAGAQADLSYVSPALSADGQWLALAAYRGGDSDPALPDLYAVVEAHLTQPVAQLRRVDLAGNGTPPTYRGTGDAPVGHPAISGDGRVVAWDFEDMPISRDDDIRSAYGPAAGNYEGNYPDVYVSQVNTTSFDDVGSQPVTSARLVSSVHDGTTTVGPGDGAQPGLSADGRYLAFVTDRPKMWTGPTGVRSTTSCLSGEPVESSGPSFAEPQAAGGARTPATPRDAAPGAVGRVAAGPRDGVRPFAPPTSGSSSPVEENGPRTVCQIVTRDLVADDVAVAAAANARPAPLPPTLPAAQLTSPSIHTTCPDATATDVCPGDKDSAQPVTLSTTGRRVGYDSLADDLVDGDTNQTDGNDFYYVDSFVRTWTPKLTVTPNPADYGTVTVGSSSPKSFTATVDGFGPVDVGTITVGGSAAGDFAVGTNACANHALHQDAPCPFTVTFTPSTTGDRGATITVPDTDGPATVTIPVTATGGPKTSTSTSTTPPVTVPGELAVGPAAIDFGSAIPLKTGGTRRTVTIRNTGGQGLTVSSVGVVDGSVPGANGDYAVEQPSQANGCLDASNRIPPGGSCTLTITWIGTAVGPRPGVLVVTSSSGSAPVQTGTVALTAVVPPPEISVNPAVVVGGRVTQLAGDGFAPKHLVTVRVPFSADPTVKTDAKGRFEVSVVLLRNAPAGPVPIVAAMPGLDPSISARTPLLVVLGSVQGPILVTRH